MNMLKKIVDFKLSFLDRISEYIDYVSFEDVEDEQLLNRLNHFLKAYDNDRFWIELYNLRLSETLVFGRFFMKSPRAFQRDMMVELNKQYLFDFNLDSKLQFSDKRNFLACVYKDYAISVKPSLTNTFVANNGNKMFFNFLANWTGEVTETVSVDRYLKNLESNQFGTYVNVEKYIRKDYDKVIDIGLDIYQKDLLPTISKLNDILSQIKKDVPGAKVYLDSVVVRDKSNDISDMRFIRFLVVFDFSCRTSFATNF